MKSEEEIYITCMDKQGAEHRVSKEDLSFRISVCGVLTKGNQVYLVKDRTTDKWELPGGGVEKGEHIENTLMREFLEETGIIVKPGKLHTYTESFYYMRDPDGAYQNLRLFLYVSPMSDTQKGKGSYVRLDNLNIANTNELTLQALKELSLDHQL